MAINLEVGEDRDRVIKAIVERLGAIADVLGAGEAGSAGAA